MKRGLIHDPPRSLKKGTRRAKRGTFTLRKPKNYAIQVPGDLVQIDTLELILCQEYTSNTLLPGI